MSQKYLKPVKRFVSRKTALEKLDLTNKKFDKLCVLNAIYPVIADSKHSYDIAEGWYYKIDDIKKLYFSDSLKILRKNCKKDEKRENFLKFGNIEKAKHIKNEETNFIDLVKNKYNKFGDSLEDLGNTIKNLYLIKILKVDDVDQDLSTFQQFIIDENLLNRAFLSRKGVFYSFNCSRLIVFWFVPYPSYNLNDYAEEKEDKFVKQRIDLDFLEFDLSSDDEESTEKNDPAKMDISLLKYGLPLYKKHLQLSLHKLKTLFNNENRKRNLIFNDRKFCIQTKSIFEEIKFVILSGKGQICDFDESEIVITETIEDLVDGKIYLQPQYIFDSLNQGKMLGYDLYHVGKTCPKHISPFPETIDRIDERALKVLSNKKKYDILDRIESLD